MNDDSDEDVETASSSANVLSPLERDPGSNEFVNVTAPEIETRTSSVEEIPKPIPPTIENIVDNDAGTDAPIFTDEIPLQLEPEPMTETEMKEPLGAQVDDNDDEPQMPGSFDMSTTHTQEQTSWAEILKKLHLQ